LDRIKDFRNPHEARLTEHLSGRKPPAKFAKPSWRGEKTGKTPRANLFWPRPLGWPVIDVKGWNCRKIAPSIPCADFISIYELK
jgi:hypothetical protein